MTLTEWEAIWNLDIIYEYRKEMRQIKENIQNTQLPLGPIIKSTKVAYSLHIQATKLCVYL